MTLEPKDVLERLEFDKILAITENECLSELGKAEVKRIYPQSGLNIITRSLEQTKEMKEGMETNDRLPLSAFEDISQDLEMLAIEGYVLSIEGIQRINRILRNFGEVNNYFNPGRKLKYPHLFDIIRDFDFDPGLIKAINIVIDENGDIRPDASPLLLKIKKQIASKQRELDKVFKNLVMDFRNKGWLTDSVESIRNGRRVLSVPSEHKRKIRGIIHDESATGQTAFLEPEPIIDINNDIFDLETEEKREIYRLLKELCAMLHPYSDSMAGYQSVLVKLDVIQAKGRLGLKMGAMAPKIREDIFFGIWQAYHPLLLLKNKQLGKKTIPFDLTLLYDNRILLVSGPNAGGKSIFMKAVGLLQLMVQSGFLVPVRGDTEMGIFKKIFSDIGDQQSLEDDLSTYSSRLENMRNFLEKSDKSTLVLIDEFGSGTDPKIGGAIAEAILKILNEKGVYGVITTHYSNLKMFAFKAKGIVNGAMHFDKDSLAPTYELKVGRPGSSYAFEIATKTGLPKEVLKYARHRAGKNERAVDELLIDLQREKQEVEEKLESIKKREKDLDRLMKSYEDMSRDLEFRRKKIKLEAKEKAMQEAAQESRELNKLIKEIREQQNLEKAKQLIVETKKDQKELQEEVKDLREKVYFEPDKKKKEEEIKVGDFVKIRSSGTNGEVEIIEKKKAIVKVGDLRMTLPLRELVLSREPLDKKTALSITTDTVSANSNFESKIDIRGLRMADAMKVLEDFVDQALMTNANTLRIVHGKGDGVLRKAVKRKLQEYQDIQEIYHPEQEFGGNGVTIVEMA
ncbi:MAG: Smr/MutS family protein [Saprospiraceae bacterium]